MAGSDEHAGEYRRLMAELEQLERERQLLDLRDARSIHECERKIEALRKRIASYIGGAR
jgi:hypothetical protein